MVDYSALEGYARELKFNNTVVDNEGMWRVVGDHLLQWFPRRLCSEERMGRYNMNALLSNGLWFYWHR